IGDVLIEDDRVAALTFTGSGDVGWKLKERAPRKHVSLELGNATPVIVCDDAPDGVAAALAANGFSFAGQSCISVQRVYVHEAVWDRFVAEFVPKVEALRVGDPADEETDVGPVIDDDARERILEWIAEADGELLTGGEATDEGLIRPTVIANPSPDAKVSCEEVFGPVVTLTRIGSLDEAIERANSTRYGLQAGGFTTNTPPAPAASPRPRVGRGPDNRAPAIPRGPTPVPGRK